MQTRELPASRSGLLALYVSMEPQEPIPYASYYSLFPTHSEIFLAFSNSAISFCSCLTLAPDIEILSCDVRKLAFGQAMDIGWRNKLERGLEPCQKIIVGCLHDDSIHEPLQGDLIVRPENVAGDLGRFGLCCSSGG